MSARHSQSDRSRRRKTTSVVGSKVSDVSSRLGGRRLPRGGIREKDGLTVAEGAMPDTTLIGKQGGKQRARGILRIVAIVSGSLAVLLVLFGIAMAILSTTSMFSVQQIETSDSEHLAAETVARLAAVDGNTTLLNVDAAAIEERVKKNPWVGSVDVVREFPSTLRLEVHERKPAFYVVMGHSVGWLMGEDGVWIEPLQLEEHSSQSTNDDMALKKAESLGMLLIYNVPTSVSPEAGTSSTDDCIAAVTAFRNQLSAAFKEQIVAYSASSEDDIACILDSGIEISLGSPSNIDSKEMVAQSILDEYAGQVTYINVRIPSRPTYRRVDSKYVDRGTGATGVEIEPMKEKTDKTADSQNSTGVSGGSASSSSSGNDATTTSGSNGSGTTGSAYDNASDALAEGTGYNPDTSYADTESAATTTGYSGNDYASSDSGVAANTNNNGSSNSNY